jgi:hypothetical protein
LESVVVSKGVEVHGGFDCSSSGQWSWKKGTKSKLRGTPNFIPLTVIASAAAFGLDDMIVEAASSAPSVMGGSSIAMVVDGVAATLNRCELVAGDASSGLNGEDADPTPPPTPMKTVSNDGKPACAVLGGGQSIGGEEAVNDCGGGVISVGGLGGKSTKLSSTAGDSGMAIPPTSIVGGAAGLGDTLCAGGGAGKLGADGDPGVSGAGGTGLGSLDISVGWLGADGKAGAPGKPGQGGGGGGARKGGANVCSGGPGTGPTGGSGGAGGCGGQPGGGGRAGGSSIALVSLNSTSTVVTLIESKLSTGKGGDGGKGGKSQISAPGGMPGVGGSGMNANLQDACDGGKGGQGGAGGPGGGGAGGHSIPIAYHKTKPTIVKTTLTPGTAGAPGLGGTIGNTVAPPGDPGMAPVDGTLMFP